MEILIWLAIVAIAFWLGYWLGHRGLAGIKSDLQDARDELDRLKE